MAPYLTVSDVNKLLLSPIFKNYSSSSRIIHDGILIQITEAHGQAKQKGGGGGV